MDVIQVCIGSSCHLKGSYEVVQKLKQYIAEKGMEDKIELKSSFCLGKCSLAVSVQVNEEPICSVAPETVETFFKTNILSRHSL